MSVLFFVAWEDRDAGHAARGHDTGADSLVRRSVHQRCLRGSIAGHCRGEGRRLMWLRLSERLVRYLDLRVEQAMRDIDAMSQDIPMVYRVTPSSSDHAARHCDRAVYLYLGRTR